MNGGAPSFALKKDLVAAVSPAFAPRPDARYIGKVILGFWPLDRLIFFEW